jgi:hypothetical protein
MELLDGKEIIVCSGPIPQILLGSLTIYLLIVPSSPHNFMLLPILGVPRGI